MNYQQLVDTYTYLELNRITKEQEEREKKKREEQKKKIDESYHTSRREEPDEEPLATRKLSREELKRQAEIYRV